MNITAVRKLVVLLMHRYASKFKPDSGSSSAAMVPLISLCEMVVAKKTNFGSHP